MALNRPNFNRFTKASFHTSKFSKMKWFVQVINTPTDSGSVPTLLVHLEKARYLFNCGEGTQRLFNENTVKISKLKTIFSTQNSWSHIGGLPGLLLTLGSIGVTNLNVYGPKNIDKTLDATRHFTQQAAVSFNSKIFDSNSPVYSDDSLSVYPILKPSTFDSTNNLDISQFNTNNSSQNLPDYKKKDSIASFICVGPEVPKKFDVKKAISLGLKPGPQFKELVAGKSIIAPNGNEIFPHQVLFDSKPRGAFILVECPNEDSIPFIISNKNFSQFFDSSKSNNEKSTDTSDPDSITRSSNEYSDNSQEIPKIDDCSIKFIFHSLGPNVLRNASYLNWMQKFPKNVTHIISSNEYCGNVNPFVQHSDLSLQLGQINPQVFPFPNYNNVPIAKLSDIDCIKNGFLPKVCLAQFNLKMEIEPDFKINTTDVIHYNNYDQSLFNFCRKVMDNPMYKNFFSKLSDPAALQAGSINNPNGANSNCENNSAKTSPENPGKFDFLVSTLGTGSAIPSCKRNVSSNLLYIPSHGFVLLDAGEGTSCQIKRLLGTNSSPRENRFSNSTYETFLENLKLVHISHNHADHHLGLAQLLEDWYAHNFSSGTCSGDEVDMDIESKKLFIICPGKFESFLTEISEFLNIGFNKLVIIRAREFIIPNFDLPRTGLAANNGIENAQSQKQFVHQGPNVFHDQSKALVSNQFVHQGQTTQYDKSQYQMRAIETKKKIQQLYDSLGLKSIYTCDVEHYGNCMGISITHKSGFQIIYSGDTRPSVNLVKLAYYLRVEHGQNLTLLLHEATLYDELLEDAIKKRHSTVSEAIGVSLAMRAENSIFTHFSQRHVGIPSFSAESVKRVNFNNFGNLVDLIGSIYSQPILDNKMPEHGIIARKSSINGASSNGYTDASCGSASGGMVTGFTAGAESNRSEIAQTANLDKTSQYVPLVSEPWDKESQRLSTVSTSGCEISRPESNRSDLESLIERELNTFKCAFAFDMAVFSLDDVVNYNQFADKMNVLFYEETKEMDELLSNQNDLSGCCCSDEVDINKAKTNKKRKNSS
ncbi:Ribonuclease Z [Smittium culicis]|uniref:ribonuclease Z n=1 Tax=Smittium culicis TaxID=133412 RepID=A0A1R1YBQ4_9FUNG|nr:Ribonuclease Z [Smittium culicis]